MQIQLQLISPINYNLNGQNEKVIMPSEAKAKINKPNVLISLSNSDDLNKLSPKTSMFNTFFGGKEKHGVNESTLILEVENSTTISPISSTLNSVGNIEHFQYTEKPFDRTFIPLLVTTNNYSKISNISNNTDYEKILIVDDSKLIINAVHLQRKTTFSFYVNLNTLRRNVISFLDDAENRKKFHDDFKTDAYNITSNQSLSSDIIEISTMGNSKSYKNHGKQKKRSLKLFFDSEVQVSKCCNLNV